MDYLRQILKEMKAGRPCGIPSFCTANDIVIEACMEEARKTGSPVLVEATANQVNQFGGYTGMKPADFRDFVYGIADRIHFPREGIILGGDHLGPLIWSSLPEKEAMDRAEELVRLFVLAGFTKIHLDTSMKLGDDSKDGRLSDETIAGRGARLYRASIEAYEELRKEHPEAERPVFIIGSEVPIPGGAQEAEDSITVTSPENLSATIEAYRKAFSDEGMEDAFSDIIAVVVQPGVEFGDSDVFMYSREKASRLTAYASSIDSIMLEGHSTDYQSAECLRMMVEDGVGILKVGPALTFALREGLYSLSLIEKLLLKEGRSDFIEVLEKAMLEKPSSWQKHYHGSDEEKRIKRMFSYSDRCRYYLTDPAVKEAIDTLIRNIDSIQIPMGMLHQFMPRQYRKVRDGLIGPDARSLLKDSVASIIDDYSFATAR